LWELDLSSSYFVAIFAPMRNLYLACFCLCCLCLACKHANEYKNRVTTVENIPESELLARPAFDLQGHRGARGLMPENTIEACQKAIDLGVNTLELDLVVSRDSQLVVSHEHFLNASICLGMQGDTLTEEQGKKINLYEMVLADIQKCDCGSLGNPKFPEQKKIKTFKPTLRQLVQATEAYAKKHKKGSLLFYNLEIKSEPKTDSTHHPKPNFFAELVYQEIKALRIMERTTIQSFDVRPLQEMKKLNEEISLAYLVENRLPLKENIQKLGFVPTIYSPMQERLTEAEIKQAHELGMKVIPWTVNEKADMTRLQKWKVDGIITDYPNRFQEK
jgi:glycerophosphoryl diester phosphodiesterase